LYDVHAGLRFTLVLITPLLRVCVYLRAYKAPHAGLR